MKVIVNSYRVAVEVMETVSNKVKESIGVDLNHNSFKDDDYNALTEDVNNIIFEALKKEGENITAKVGALLGITQEKENSD